MKTLEQSFAVTNETAGRKASFSSTGFVRNKPHLDLNKPVALCGLEAKQVTVLCGESSRNIGEAAKEKQGKEHDLALPGKTWSVPQTLIHMNLWFFKKDHH